MLKWMNMGVLSAALVLLALLTGGPALAEKTIWIDDRGVVHTDDKGGPGSAMPQVELYVTSWCSYCKQAASFFRARGIPFTAYDVEKDKEAALRMTRIAGRGGVPLAVINGRSIRGYSAEAYERALAEGR